MDENVVNLENMYEPLREPYLRGLATIKENEKKEEERMKKEPFEWWRDDQRPIPNAMARSMIFKATKNMDEFRTDEERLEAIRGYTILSSGPVLTQEHKDIYSEILQLFRGKEATNTAHSTARELIKNLSLKDGTNTRQRLLKMIDQIAFTRIKIDIDLPNKKVHFAGSLLNVISVERKGTGEIDIEFEIPAKMRLYFKQDDKTYIKANIERTLKGEGSLLAKALYSFYSSHKEPYGMKIDTVCNLFGVKIKNNRRRKQTVKTALALLHENGFLKSYMISKNNLVMVERNK
jgi:hypothetical protein